MSREIRWRAWNKDKNEWNTNWLMLGVGGGLMGDEIGKKLDHLKNHVVEFYTGLKDKNGKEIYEGDVILKEYGANIFKYRVWWYRGKLQLHEIGGRQWDVDFPAEFQMETIGNIHENPELLEGKDNVEG